MFKESFYISRCIGLAKCGLGYVAPNPLVGCVIVCDDIIIGEGFHKEYGGAHAEVNAVNSVHNKELLTKSTLYVNLEPCSHFGKTPPCADLIIKSGIPKVTIGMTDPFKEVAGKGIKKLKDAGIQVVAGVMEAECRGLNKRFVTFHEKKRPYIILKWAQTLDGFIGIKSEKYAGGKPAWITDEKLKVLVHKWRTEEQAIMVGTNTALLDNPQLNAREWQGKNPLRIVIDGKLRLPENLNIFDKSIPSLVFTSVNNEAKIVENPEYIRIDFNGDLITQICDELYKRDIRSLFVEGGAALLQTFIEKNIWDEARIFTGNKRFGDGVLSPVINGMETEKFVFGKDSLLILKNENPV